MTYETVLLERKGAVGLITLNRPQALNALSAALIRDLGAALDELEADDAIGAVVITGSDKAFAAGARPHPRQRKALPRRPRHKGEGEPHLYGRLSQRLHHQGLGARQHLPQA